MCDKLKICELKKTTLLLISAFYFIFSISFLFFQESKNPLPLDIGQPTSLHSISFNKANSFKVSLKVYASEGFVLNSLHGLIASVSNFSVQKVYRHRQRYDLGSRSQYSKILLFAVLVLFAPVILAVNNLRHRYNHFFLLFSPFPLFLSITSLRI